MSRTYNSKYDYILKRGIVIYGEDIPSNYKNYATYTRQKGIEYYEDDITGTTGNHFGEHYVLAVRHPNKRRKKASFVKDFNINGVNCGTDMKWRFSGDSSKSTHLKAVKHAHTKIRRCRLNRIAKEEIDRELNEY